MGDGFIFAWEEFELRLPLVQCMKGSYCVAAIVAQFLFLIGDEYNRFRSRLLLLVKTIITILKLAGILIVLPRLEQV